MMVKNSKHKYVDNYLNKLFDDYVFLNNIFDVYSHWCSWSHLQLNDKILYTVNLLYSNNYKTKFLFITFWYKPGLQPGLFSQLDRLGSWQLGWQLVMHSLNELVEEQLSV